MTQETILEAAQSRWRACSESQVQAAKVAEAARDELERLDAAIAAEEGKSEAAKEAQRAAILAEHGFGDKPKGAVKAAESVLLGAAAAVDVLRSFRPALERKIAEADAVLAQRDAATKRAEQDILNEKFDIAEQGYAFALAAFREAWAQRCGASRAATGCFIQWPLPHHIFGTMTDADYDAVASKLRAAAEIGE